MVFRSVLQKPENERYFRWNGHCLSLRADAPADVVRAWRVLCDRGRAKRPRWWQFLKI